MNVGGWIFDMFGGDGAWGLLLVIFLVFLLDAFAVPTLPEFFFVLACMANEEGGYAPNLVWGGELLLAAVLAEAVGIGSLYCVVKHAGVPRKIGRLVSLYSRFLVLGDERLLLLNRVAPMIPFAGAFIAVAGWDPGKSLAYVVAGCIAKYGLIALLAGFFYGFFGGEAAQWFTLIMIFAVIGISMALSFVVKKREGIGKNAEGGSGRRPAASSASASPAGPPRAPGAYGGKTEIIRTTRTGAIRLLCRTPSRPVWGAPPGSHRSGLPASA